MAFIDSFGLESDEEEGEEEDDGQHSANFNQDLVSPMALMAPNTFKKQ